MKKFYQVLFGKNRFLVLPLKTRLFISYLGDYNGGEFKLSKRIFSGLRLNLPHNLWARQN